jgi:hypothetical protein
MTYCGQCGTAARDDALFCHRCGARLAAEAPTEHPAPAADAGTGGRSPLIWILSGLGLVIVIGAIASSPNSTPPASSALRSPETAMPGLDPQAGNGAAPASPGSWQYRTTRDEMRNAEERIARVQSLNSLHFDFPYGDAFGQISIRQSPRFGFDIFLTIDNGQFVCHSFTGGRIAAKFDDEPILNYPCDSAADGSPTILFLGHERDFLSRLRRARRVVIEVDFYQAGRQQLRFDVAGLRWGERVSPRPTR